MSTQLFQSLAISLLLGGLVGLQRQHVDSPLGGVRTFPLVTVFGSLCAILAEPFGGWLVAAGLLATVAVIALGSWQVRSEADRGITSEAAMQVMFAVGALCVSGPIIIAVAVGGGVAVLLQFKPQLHGLVTKLEDAGSLSHVFQLAAILIAQCHTLFTGVGRVSRFHRTHEHPIVWQDSAD